MSSQVRSEHTVINSTDGHVDQQTCSGKCWWRLSEIRSLAPSFPFEIEGTQSSGVSNRLSVNFDAESDTLEENPCHLQLFPCAQDHSTHCDLCVLLHCHPHHSLSSWGWNTKVGFCVYPNHHHPSECCWHSKVLIFSKNLWSKWSNKKNICLNFWTYDKSNIYLRTITKSLNDAGRFT